MCAFTLQMLDTKFINQTNLTPHESRDTSLTSKACISYSLDQYNIITVRITSR